MRTPRAALREMQRRLEAIYPPMEARAMARRLAEHATGCPYYKLALDGATRLGDDALSVMGEGLSRLLAYEPLQYVLGESDFCGLTLRVSPAVLIPRPETEQLTMALRESYRGLSIRVADVCTGSGAIAVALAAALPGAYVEACDISVAALDVARENAERHGVNVRFEVRDVLSPDTFWPSGVWDLLVSNPPYVPASRAAMLSPSVARYEPREALYVPDDDPLLFYRTILQRAKCSLREGGMMAFEMDSEYAAQLAGLAKRIGYAAVEVANDLSGRSRYLLAADGAGKLRVAECRKLLEE